MNLTKIQRKAWRRQRNNFCVTGDAMRLAIIPNLTRENARQVTYDVCTEFDKLGAEYYILDEIADSFRNTKAVFATFDEMLKQCDVVISVGGDGTIIHAAKLGAEYGKAVLGINAGRLAFMAGLEPDELNLLSRLIDGSYSIDRRMMLKVTAKNPNGKEMSGFCINDAVITRNGSTHIIELDVECAGQRINNYLGDGIIFATPTGSTAYSLSAGGPVIEPQLETIILTPVCTHSLFSRSLIFTSDKVMRVVVKDGEGAALSCDGESPFMLCNDSVVTIRKADFFADFIRIKSDTFIDILNSKLSERRA